MTATSFVDSRVLIYKATPGLDDWGKAKIAGEILQRSNLGRSVQVCQEFYVQAIRPTRPNRVSHEEALAFIRTWKRFPIQPLTEVILDRAFVGCDRWKISYRDAAIIEAARELGCREVSFEDLSDGRDYDGIRVINPFA